MSVNVSVIVRKGVILMRLCSVLVVVVCSGVWRVCCCGVRRFRRKVLMLRG